MSIKLGKLSARQKSLVLSILAGVGVAATGVISAVCSKKASKKDTKKEKVFAYVPAIVAGGATIGCIAASTHISGEEIAVVTAVCAAIGQKFSDYKKSVAEVVTDEQLSEIDRAFYEKEIARLEQELAEREHPSDEDDLATFVDSYTGYTFKARDEDVDEGLKKIQRMYDDQEYFYWCDIFYVLNKEDTTPYNSRLGANDWYHEGYGWSKAMFEQFDCEDGFDIYLTPMKGRENTYIIEYAVDPEPGFMEY